MEYEIDKFYNLFIIIKLNIKNTLSVLSNNDGR